MTRKLHALRAYRHEKGVPAAEIAKTLGIAESTLWSYENGNRVIDGDFAVHIEKMLGIPRAKIRDDLFGDPSPSPEQAAA